MRIASSSLGSRLASGSLLLAAMCSVPASAMPGEAAPSTAAHPADPYAAGSRIVSIAGNRYRFPRDSSVRIFPDGNPELGLRNSFWSYVVAAVVPASGWLAADNGVYGARSLTRPNDLWQWRGDRPEGEPPVRGPVHLLRQQKQMRVWLSKDPEIAEAGKIYLTFVGRNDLYGECQERNVGDWQRACDIWWLDRGIMHQIALPGDILEHAPAIADRYAALVVVRP